MRALKLPARITRDHHLHLQLPDELAEGPAEVILLIPDSADEGVQQGESWTLRDFLRPRVDQRYVRSKQDIAT
jgi:hypothetical protein